MQAPRAIAEAEPMGDALLLKVSGAWRLTGDLPNASQILSPHKVRSEIRVEPKSLQEWDSSLPLFLVQLGSWCREHGLTLDLEALPASLKDLFRLIQESERKAPPPKSTEQVYDPFTKLVRPALAGVKDSIEFVGQCVIAMIETPADPRRVRWKDLFIEMVEAGPKALPVIALLNFLFGVVFAYETASQLRRFGATAFVTPALGLAMVRQVGPILSAIILAGRTGAAFAAHIGNMKLGGEIDALKVLGVSPVSYLALPRLVALFCMLPMIALYGDLFGFLGGLVTSYLKLQTTPTEFWIGIKNSLSTTDFIVGLVKAGVFGVAIGMAGTLRGLQCERSSAGVGRATTSAVVTGICWVIIADTFFAFILDTLGY